MFNELKHTFYTTINDLKYELGFISYREYSLAKLQENARFYGDELKEFVIEAKNETFKAMDKTLEIAGDYLHDLTPDWV